MKAVLKNYRQSPRKVRTVANFVKGKQVEVALAELDLLAKRASLPLKKLIQSAVANAENNLKADKGDLFIKEITVDQGMVLKRSMPMSRGRAFPIRKKMSHVKLTLGIKEVEPKVKKEEKVEKKAKAKKA